MKPSSAFNWLFFIYGVILLTTNSLPAHESTHPSNASAQYLGNEAVLITTDQHKLLFDPFFHKTFGIYQAVPDSIRQSMMDGKAPYNNVDFMFISHAHDDHFSAQDVLTYLTQHKHVKLFAPRQAVNQLTSLKPDKTIKDRLFSISLLPETIAWKKTIDNTLIEAVRIPHAGWPARADVENLVFRVTDNSSDNKKVTVMHMGDADPNPKHFLTHKNHWQKRKTSTAFPPYWFMLSREGQYILNNIINSHHNVGIHVPVKVPENLKQSGYDYFSKPGEQQEIHFDSQKKPE
jgi:L-ascorbate metabolism protein UlaG (beta-lactamase superfamily)